MPVSLGLIIAVERTLVTTDRPAILNTGAGHIRYTLRREASMQFNTIEEVLEDFRLGKMVLILDDEDRENEGDLIIAQRWSPLTHHIFRAGGVRSDLFDHNRAASHPAQFAANGRPQLFAAENELYRVHRSSRWHHHGYLRFRSGSNRSHGVARHATPNDLVMPGHIFPLIAKQGGVLTRAGHTEAGCDLARLSGYEPASVIVEVMNEDGTMAKRPELEQFAKSISSRSARSRI